MPNAPLSAAYEAISFAMSRIDDELYEVAKKEGLPHTIMPTGKMWVDVNAECVWYEVLDTQHNVLSWVTPDMPENAAIDETLVAAASLDEAEELGR